MKTELYMEKADCCGCGACMNICKIHAIEMKPDENGFLYPKIDFEKCINCGQCKNVCLYQNSVQNKSNKETYAAATISTDPMTSASGGIFAGLAKTILQSNGIVYGCAMIHEHGKLFPRHIAIADEKDLELLQGSKYVQSDMGLIYQDVKKNLINQRLVMFSGTPCQVAGLKGFLGKEYGNLFTIDIICHGVPSVQMFQDYIKYVEQKKNKKVIEYKFRDKKNGWKLLGKMVLEDSNGDLEECFFEPEESSYYQLFLDGYNYRENCYSCPFACDNRQGNITIGDYWCIDLVCPEMLIQNNGVFDENKGISCLIVNDEHGKKMLDVYGDGIQKVLSTYENVAKYNAQLNHPVTLRPERVEIMSKYAHGYANVEKWYKARMIPIKVKRFIRRLVPKKIKTLIKNLYK